MTNRREDEQDCSRGTIRESRVRAICRLANRWKPAQPQLARFLSPDPIGADLARFLVTHAAAI